MKDVITRLLLVFSIVLVFFTASGFSEDIAFEISFNRNGSGTFKVDFFFNESFFTYDYLPDNWSEEWELKENEKQIREFAEETQQHLKDYNIKSSILLETKNGKKGFSLSFDFNNANIFNEIDIPVSFSQQDDYYYVEFNHVDFDENVSFTVKMPGQIIESNGKHQGSSAHWKPPFEEKLWAKSKEFSGLSRSFGILSALILVLVIALFLLVIMNNRSKNRLAGQKGNSRENQEQKSLFCGNCGANLNRSDAFCSECGNQIS